MLLPKEEEVIEKTEEKAIVKSFNNSKSLKFMLVLFNVQNWQRFSRASELVLEFKDW